MPNAPVEAQEARQVLARFLPVTRMVSARGLARQTGVEVHLKLESELPTGSFKPRGAIYALHKNLQRGRISEVAASSTGNHGAAVAYAARLLGMQSTIFLPENPNPVKRARIEELGARIVEGGRDLAEAFDRAGQYARRPDIYFMRDGYDPDMPAGAGTIACEIFEQLSQVGTIFVPMGDTTLIRGVAGVAKQLAPSVHIIGVQAERAPAYYLSWRAGQAITTDSCDTIADGLATRRPHEENVQAIRRLVDDVRLVSESEMLRAIRYLLLEEHLVAEAAGAASTAAFLQNPGAHAGRKVVLLLTGANIPPETLKQALSRD